MMNASYNAAGAGGSGYQGTPTLDPNMMRTPNTNNFAQSLERDRILTMGRMSSNKFQHQYQ